MVGHYMVLLVGLGKLFYVQVRLSDFSCIDTLIGNPLRKVVSYPQLFILFRKENTRFSRWSYQRMKIVSLSCILKWNWDSCSRNYTWISYFFSLWDELSDKISGKHISWCIKFIHSFQIFIQFFPLLCHVFQLSTP